MVIQTINLCAKESRQPLPILKVLLELRKARERKEGQRRTKLITLKNAIQLLKVVKAKGDQVAPTCDKSGNGPQSTVFVVSTGILRPER